MISSTDWSAQLDFRRHQLRMPKRILAKRAGVSLPTINRILSRKDQNPRLLNVRAIAAALGVDVLLGTETTVCATQSVHDFRKAQATAKANRLVKAVQGTMGLEAQAVDAETLRQMIEQTTAELLAGPPRKLWGD
jgi:transcriptional regulator with XRE-family HTH domain